MTTTKHEGCCEKCRATQTVISQDNGTLLVSHCINVTCACHFEPTGAGMRAVHNYEVIAAPIREAIWKFPLQLEQKKQLTGEMINIFTVELSRLHSRIVEELRKDILSYAHKECEQGKCEPCEICLSSLLADSGLYKAEKIINQAFKDL